MAPPTPDIALAERLFDGLREASRAGAGIVRESYGAGEQGAHDFVRAEAEALGLICETDAALNLYMTLRGRERRALVIGSHLDSVPQGGNYDGAAGVLAGLAVVAGLRKAGITPRHDLTVMAIRAEEAAWFDWAYIGSTAAFGHLPVEALDVCRSDDGRTLAAHMEAAGADLPAIRDRRAHFDPAQLRAYFELHIEQGPVLEAAGLPVGVVTGIRGSHRHRRARCFGRYAHSGAQPRVLRSDAVAATVALVHRLYEEWLRREAAGEDLVVTVGELTTDPTMHGPSKVAGETRFVLDFRSTSAATMRAIGVFAAGEAMRVGAAFNVRFDLGEPSWSEPAVLDANLRGVLRDAASTIGVPAMELASGAGHDAAVFANLGVPSAMIFVRNAHGSHNPDEAMSIEDFAAGTNVLARAVTELA